MGDVRGGIAFWNVQRLFSGKENPIEAALAPPGGRLTPSASRRKVASVGKAVGELCKQHGVQSLFGFAEIETKDLVSSIIEASEVDFRNVDTEADDELADSLTALDLGLIYDPKVFDPPSSIKTYVIDGSLNTRDLLEVHLRVRRTQQDVCVLVTHWPSRLISESADRRTAAAYFTHGILERLMKFQLDELWDSNRSSLVLPPSADLLKRASTPVVLMGDFNDEPFDASLTACGALPDEARVSSSTSQLSRRSQHQVAAYLSDSVYLWNPAWSLLGQYRGSFYRDPRWRIYDQILISSGASALFGKRTFDVFVPKTIDVGGEIVHGATSTGRPRGFDVRTGQGISDHFPVLALSR
jgi:endonuclease/exonuclease/phosphatase family metal-dependent hydrolase